MDPLVARQIEHHYGVRQVLRGCHLIVGDRDRIGLVGANGSGKSTLVRILAGELKPDHGSVVRRGRLSSLDQEPDISERTVGEAADAALAWHQRLCKGYEDALNADDVATAAQFQEQLDLHGWDLSHRVDAMLQRVKAPPRSAPIHRLSGGELRRTALAITLLASPDVLLLDEPTNHLDAETVTWLESFLRGFRGAVLIVTHDRYLLEAVVDRIVEVEDGELVSYEGSYGDYLVARAERRSRLEQAEDSRLNMLAREAAWAARSPAARSTKQRARLQRLDQLRETRPLIQEHSLALDLRSGDKPGGTAVEIHDLNKAFGDQIIVSGLDLVIRPGERLGVVGDNGTGKTTLIRMITGDELPDSGTLRLGPRTRMAVLDQGRTGLDDEDTVFESAGQGNDHVVVRGNPIHVASFLGRFLFPTQMLEQRVAGLSGGERARLLLAKLLLQGANLLILDEPTNDLDLMTLRVLEEALLAFDGAALVVTHDRAFLDRACTSLLAFEGDGVVIEYATRTQWEVAREARNKALEAAAPRPIKPSPKANKPKSTGLSYQERKELKALPAKIERLESEVEALEAKLADRATYSDNTIDVARLNSQFGALESDVAAAYARWESLEERS